jgi:hypothetical protein
MSKLRQKFPGITLICETATSAMRKRAIAFYAGGGDLDAGAMMYLCGYNNNAL